MVVLLAGTPLDGFTLIGPFDGHEDAYDYAERELDRSMDWWVTELEPPTKTLV